MPELRSRTTAAEGMTIAQRLRNLKRRTARWFQPPVRSSAASSESGAHDSAPDVTRGLKPPAPLH